MQFKKQIAGLAMATGLIFTSVSSGMAHDIYKQSPADDHAPIGVMADHKHNKGEWMLSYRYSTMHMDGNRDGTSDLAPADVLAQGFMMAPLEMDMDMHMFGLMYGVSDDITLMAMLPYIEKDMVMVNAGGMRMYRDSEGFGDVKLTALYTLDSHVNEAGEEKSWLLNLGLSLPTGSTDERSDTGQKLPYPMQLGSGTFDPIIRLTYNDRRQDWSWGAQAGAMFRTGTNDEGYRLGHEYGFTSWAAKNIHEKLSLSLRLDARQWDDIHGRDADLNVMMTPAARADLRGGTRVDALIGANFYQTGDFAKDNRLAVEFGMPLYQDLDGPQLKTDYRLMLGWQYAF